LAYKNLEENQQRRALRDAALIGGGSYALGASSSTIRVGTGQAFSGALGSSPETYGIGT
jgi:hypothetical protein